LNSRQIYILDQLASKACLKRNPICFMCNNKSVEPHHVIHRNHKSVRWDKHNLIGVCRDCHSLIHSDIGFNQDFIEKYDKVYGASAYNELIIKSRQIARGLDFERIKEQIAKG
jgi:hypothetical protein